VAARPLRSRHLKPFGALGRDTGPCRQRGLCGRAASLADRGAQVAPRRGPNGTDAYDGSCEASESVSPAMGIVGEPGRGGGHGARHGSGRVLPRVKDGGAVGGTRLCRRDTGGDEEGQGEHAPRAVAGGAPAIGCAIAAHRNMMVSPSFGEASRGPGGTMARACAPARR
jgi:hypothetical protein